jgi:RimJ/RimL family protein N-acetyltransferase
MGIPERIETKRLFLRPYRAGDGPTYYAAGKRNADHLAEFESGNLLRHLRDEEHAEAFVRELAADWTAQKSFFLGIFDKTDHAWVGQVTIAPTIWELPEFTIGYVADVNYEGKGFISEAVNGVLRMLFEDVGAHRVRSECSEHNVRSWRLLERCGFKREGHLRENKKSADGTVHGDLLYGLLRHEFPNR